MNEVFDFSDLQPLDLSSINQIDFPSDQYFHDIIEKRQIILHHTVSGPGPEGDIDTWIKEDCHVDTPIIISRNGVINQLYSSKFWAHSLGCKELYLRNMGFSDYKTRNDYLDSHAVAVEIDNWGPLKKINDTTYQTVYGNNVNVQATEYPNGYRGYNYYESYTKGQLIAVGQLLLFWNKRYGIPLDYHEDMWTVNKNALGGNKGVWTHASYRYDKSDCHPDPNLIKLLKQLNNLI